MNEVKWKEAPKGWNDVKICRHCWYYRVAECGGMDCYEGGKRGYFTIQEMPVERLTREGVVDSTINGSNRQLNDN